MQTLEDLPTPSVLIDLDVLARNIARMQERARAAGVKLRPHAKTHKSPEVGRMQIAAGASGLTLAKTSEAEVFADHGFEDLFLGYRSSARTRRGAARPRRPGSTRGRCGQRRGRSQSRRRVPRGGPAAGRAPQDRQRFRRVGVRPEDAVAMALRSRSCREFASPGSSPTPARATAVPRRKTLRAPAARRGASSSRPPRRCAPPDCPSRTFRSARRPRCARAWSSRRHRVPAGIVRSTTTVRRSLGSAALGRTAR